MTSFDDDVMSFQMVCSCRVLNNSVRNGRWMITYNQYEQKEGCPRGWHVYLHHFLSGTVWIPVCNFFLSDAAKYTYHSRWGDVCASVVGVKIYIAASSSDLVTITCTSCVHHVIKLLHVIKILKHYKFYKLIEDVTEVVNIMLNIWGPNPPTSSIWVSLSQYEQFQLLTSIQSACCCEWTLRVLVCKSF